MDRFLICGVTILCLFSQVFSQEAQVSASESDITYVFYSREKFNGVRVHVNDPSVNHISSVFKQAKPTIVLIHGFQDSYGADSNTYVRKAILDKINANIIKADWSPLAGQNYFVAKDAVPLVGRFVASFLESLSAKFQYSLSNVTLVGFSLGAHIAGNIGRNVRSPIGFIMALDPAGPLISSDVSVKRTDGAYVQSIHTNGGLLGTNNAVGHSDFYPNGGSKQPGCGIDLLGGCAHNRAWEFFAESVTDNRFVSQNCNSWNDYERNRCNGHTKLMGGLRQVDKTASGIYYLRTNNRSPYGQG